MTWKTDCGTCRHACSQTVHIGDTAYGNDIEEQGCMMEDRMTDEENALLMRLFEMGHGPLDLLPGASIRLSFDRDRTQTHDEWRQEKAAELEEMCRRVKG